MQKLISKFDETAGIISKNQVGMIRQGLKQAFEISSKMKTMIDSSDRNTSNYFTKFNLL